MPDFIEGGRCCADSCRGATIVRLAAVTALARVAAQHQSLLHFIGLGGWSDEGGAMVLSQIERHGAISAWISEATYYSWRKKYAGRCHRR